MSLVVNTNILSINAQRNLSKTNSQLSVSMERLSSGLRINSARDDAAGMAIATDMESQIRGLMQAARNSNDGLSLIATAEGGLSKVSDILQRMRELSVQAANDTNTDTNRQTIQKEINQLIEELSRLGNTLDFNGRKLLNGTFQNMNLQVGANAGEVIQTSLSDFRSEAVGRYAHNVGTNEMAAVAISGAATGGGSVTITSVNSATAITVGSSAGLDTVSSTNADYSAIAKAAAINAVSGQTGVEALVVNTTETATAAVAAGTVTSLTLNGISVIGTAFTTVASDTDKALRDRINAFSAQTGVTASLDDTNKLVLTAKDGRNITIAGTVGTSNLTVGTTYGKVSIWSSSGFAIADASNVLGDGAAVSYSPDSAKAVSKIQVTTFANATDAIKSIDAALVQLNSETSRLGAVANRLKYTGESIAVTTENLSAAQSRIRDADFAAETASLTRSQIMIQSGVAILTQANVQPQSALAALGA